MKRIVFIIGTILIPILGMAQLRIESVEVSPMDLTSRTQKRLDINGVPCALVKVEMKSPQATFQGNVVGEVAYYSGEYCVYVTNGTKSIKMFHPDQSPVFIDFTKHGIESLVSGQTYTVRVFVPSNIPVMDVAEVNEKGYEAYEKKDYATAFQFYQTAAAYNSPEAMFMLSIISDEDGDSSNDSEGNNWLRRSAELGYPPAQYQFGVKCFNGEVIRADKTEAVKWFEKAALQGMGPAMFNLGTAYQFGYGVDQNFDEAEYWYCMAIRYDYEVEHSQQRLDKVRENLVHPQSEFKSFSLFCEKGFLTYCFTPDVWNSIPEDSRKYYEPVGIFMEVDNSPFVIMITQERNLDYNDACEKYSDHIMTEKQAQFVQENAEVFLNNWKRFGIENSVLDGTFDGAYWIKVADEATHKFIYFVEDGAVIFNASDDSVCAVRPVINLTRE